MRAIHTHRPSDVEDGPQQEDPVVILLEVVIALVFTCGIGLAVLCLG